ncbi:hypothetical protein JTE90_022835 [Oedothorax gibbosus]|uniref:Major facilitator superfamily (MFS) profile domain-containing protein n=1 Tax=Oedothorax gibbosus TaxID=931172 RepID=A0AAV6V5F5_9ARAC|nr:hypothetical protein JTE90_022835 [Oedothorax gibbosus]
MDSTINKSGKDVDTNDSNLNGTLYETEITSGLKCGSVEQQSSKSQSSTHSVSTSTSSSGSSIAASGLALDGGWGWVVVLASFMINFIADGISFSFGILFMDFVEYFGSSKAKASWVGSIFFSMPLLAGPVASYLIDRYGCRRMCILGALMSTFSFVASIWADSLELLFLTFSLAGLGLALCYVTSIVIVAYYFEKKRSLATGLAACGTGIGTFVFPPFTIFLLEQYAWPGTLLILSGFFLNMAVFGALMRDLEFPSRDTNCNTSKSMDNVFDNLDMDTNNERLCSSMVQLPTYLGNNCHEVISELYSKEGTCLNSLLEQHPYILDSIVEQGPHKPAGKKSKKKSHHKNFKFADHKISSVPGRLDAAYLRNLKLSRGSITYRGAMLNIHRYRLKASSCPDIFRNSMVTITEEKSCLFLHDLKDLMLEMFDFSNFKNIGYTIFCLSNFILYACVDVPYVYIPDHATTTGTDKESASLLISVLGVLNCLGVVIVGYIGDKPWIDSSLLYSGFIVFSGVSLIFLPVVVHYYMTATLVGIYGFMISANYTLVPIIIVNLISMDNFTGAYGLLLLVQGIASLVGPPAAGALFDMTGNYDITFYTTGLLIIISGAMMIPVAKSFVCSKTGVADTTKELVLSEARKVKFQDEVEKGSVRFLSTTQEMKILRDESIYSLDDNEDRENSLPLLSNNRLQSSSEGDEACKNMSVYANPLTIA